jgi:hypothetical protein
MRVLTDRRTGADEKEQGRTERPMVPRGGIEPSPIQLKVHHFLYDDFPVYPPVDPALSWRGREGATLCRHIQIVRVTVYERSPALCRIPS